MEQWHAVMELPKGTVIKRAFYGDQETTDNSITDYAELRNAVVLSIYKVV